MHQITTRSRVSKTVYENKDITFPSKTNPPVKCCRCFPALVTEEGWCGCCYFDHAKGERECIDNPDRDI